MSKGRHDKPSEVLHFELMAELMEWICSKGIPILEHTYNPNSFGNWSLTLGSRMRHKQGRFVWDGKDGWIYVDQRVHPKEPFRDPWETVEIVRDHSRNPKEIFETMRGLIEKHVDQKMVL